MSAPKIRFVIHFLFLFLLLAGFLFNITGSVSAAGIPCNDKEGCKLEATSFNDKVNMDNSLQNVIHGGLCIVAAQSPYNTCLAYTKNEGPKLFAKIPTGGAMGEVLGLTMAMYNPPVSTTEYLASIGENIGISSKPVYAQSVTGSGEGIIRPVLRIWQVFRNIAYIAFILVFIVIGLMIMFRQKINPQTVISAQQALPSLIIGLLLVTFSYFIAALLVDTSFLGMRLVTEIFVNALDAPARHGNSFGNADQLRQLVNNSNIFSLFSSTVGVIWKENGNTASGITNLVTNGTGLGAFAAFIPALIGAIVGSLIAFGPGTIIGAIVGGASTPIASNIVSGLISFILIIALLIQMFRLLFSLIGTYIQILINTITGPLQLLFASIPGRGGGIGGWIKSILANALVFPAVFALFLFAGAILGDTNPADWQVSPPLFGNLSSELLRLILAYGIILGSPVVPDMVRKAFNVKPLEGFDKAALGGFMAGWGTASGGLSRGYSTGMKSTGLSYEKEALQKKRLEWSNAATLGGPAAVSWRERLLERLPGVK